MRRVVITGVGSLNALGVGLPAFESGLREGRSGISRLTRFDPQGFRSAWAAEAPGGDQADGLLSAPLRRRVSYSDRMAVVAAHQALQQAAWGGDRSEIGVALGASTGGMFATEDYLRAGDDSCASVRASRTLATPVSTATDLLAQVFGCFGPRLTVSTACSSGANALGIGADWIRAGRADAVLCGGTDSLCRMTYSGFNALQALDREPCRPFDRDRAGLSLGEGAAVLLLEDRDHAVARGAAILAEFLGYGVSADAHHMTQPRPDGSSAASAFLRALAECGVGGEEIDYVNAHGTATPANDATETRVLKRCLGPRAYRVPISSTKAATGHCLAAAGAIEALVCVIALRAQFVPPTLRLEHVDPECDLDYVPMRARPARLRVVASNSYGFGGNNTTVVFRHADG